MRKGKYFDPCYYCLILSFMALRSQKLKIQYLNFLEYSCRPWFLYEMESVLSYEKTAEKQSCSLSP